MVTPKPGRCGGLAATVATVLLGACELTEVTVPQGEVQIVVQGVMRTDQAVQAILVEETLVGQEGISEENGIRAPVTNATVAVTNRTRTFGPCAGPTVFVLTDAATGRYESSGGCPELRTGDRLDLVVRVGDEFEVTGTTTVAGMSGMTALVNEVALPAGTNAIEINRDVDTLRFTVEKVSGRGLFFESQSLTGLTGIDQRVSFWVDTTSLRLFGNLVSDFDDDGAQLFRAGRFTSVSVGLMDDNFFRFFETRNDPFTGRGFDNRLEGGIGVFGSIDPRFFGIRSVGTIDDPREGLYRLAGNVNGSKVDMELELYLVDNGENAEFSAFITGTWPGVVQVLDTSVDGIFNGNLMQATLDLSISTENRLLLTAANALQDSFQITILDSADRTLGTLQASR